MEIISRLSDKVKLEAPLLKLPFHPSGSAFKSTCLVIPCPRAEQEGTDSARFFRSSSSENSRQEVVPVPILHMVLFGTAPTTTEGTTPLLRICSSRQTGAEEYDDGNVTHSIILMHIHYS